MRRSTKGVLTRLEYLANQDADCAAMVDTWRHAAAYVGGYLSQKIKMLAHERKRGPYFGKKGSLRNPFH